MRYCMEIDNNFTEYDMIPKRIHYTWFSGDEMPSKIKACMASWNRILPDYELKLWDMNAIKDIDSVFLQEALAVKKWAYAADYVRLYALYHEGGIYLDTDVMVYKSFDDLLDNHVFIGKEDSMHFSSLGSKGAQYLSSHCMGSEKGAIFIKACLGYFDDRHFITSHNDKLPQVLRYNFVWLPYIQAVIAQDYGYKWNPKVQKVQYCRDGLVIYPTDCFCGFKYLKESYCQHFSLGGWRDEYTQYVFSNTLKQKLSKLVKRLIRNITLKFSYVVMKVDA